MNIDFDEPCGNCGLARRNHSRQRLDHVWTSRYFNPDRPNYITIVREQVRPIKVKDVPHPGWTVRPHFAWNDCWIGAYYDREKRRLYLMIPFVGIWIGHK